MTMSRAISAGKALDYYRQEFTNSKDNYYSEAGEVKGRWSGGLAGQFYDAGLLDELIVQVSSVTLGSGKPLLPRNITSPALRLVSARQIGTGFAELTYAVPKPT